MGSLSTWGALATTLLALECFFGLLVVAGLVFGLNYGMDWILRKTASGFEALDRYAQQGRAFLEKYEAKLLVPFVKARAAVTGAKRGLKEWKEG